jgi:catechol 2,3-dioxygenase-like lactoylglutathione lyase family enzyme
LQLVRTVDAGTSGPGHIVVEDPDGNPILFDQHVWARAWNATRGGRPLGGSRRERDHRLRRGRDLPRGKDWPMKMNRLIPMLPVRSVTASVEFYRKLGFSVERRNDDWGWAMLRLGECRLMVDQSINQHRDAPRQSVIYLYPENVEEYHRIVRGNGLAVPDLAQTFYGMTEFRVDDPDGNRLWIGEERSRA